MKTTAISIRKNQKEFIEENDLNLSRLAREKIDELIEEQAKNPGAFLEKKDKANSSSRIKEKRKEALKLFEEIESSDRLIEKYSSEYQDEEGKKRTLDKGSLLADHPELHESQIEIVRSKLQELPLD